MHLGEHGPVVDSTEMPEEPEKKKPEGGGTPRRPLRKAKSAGAKRTPEIRIGVVQEEVKGKGKDGCSGKGKMVFGFRTYLQDLYTPPDKEMFDTLDYIEDDGFHYSVEPVRRACSWDRACVWCGIPLLIVGVVAVLVGQFVPPREPVVGRRGSLALLDRKALVYNSRLETCRLVGLAALCLAALMILLSFLLSAYSQPQHPHHQQYHTAHFYQPVAGLPLTQPAYKPPIPVSGVLRHVQPPTVVGYPWTG